MKEILKKPNENWVTCSLIELCEKKNGIQTGPFGSQLHQRDYVDVGTPIITVQHMGESRIVHNDDIPKVKDEDKERLSKFLLRTGDIILSRVGSVDITNLVTDEEDNWLFSGRCIRIRPDKNKIDPSYLSLYLRHPRVKKYLRAFAVGATMPSLNTKIIQKIPVTFPKDPKRINDISNILSELDAKIELNKKMNENCEEIAMILFKSWFIDFDPVKAKAEGKSTGLAKEISDLFPDSFEESESVEIPNGWYIGNLGNLCLPKRGKVITKSEVEPGNVPVVAGGISPPYHHSESNAVSPVVTISASGTAGYVNLYYQDIWASDCSYINKEITDYVFFIHSFLKINQQRIYDLRHGAVQQHVYPKNLIELPMVLAPVSLIKEYEKIVTSLHKKILLNIQESENLEATRDLILPKLISGELRIPDTENLVEEVEI